MQYRIRIAIDNECIDCMPLESGQAGIGLNHDGVTGADNALVYIAVQQNELHVSVHSNSDVVATIERNGRTRRIYAGQSIRLLVNDVLCFDLKRVKILSVYKAEGWTPVNRMQMNPSSVAALMMATSLAVCACTQSHSDAERSQEIQIQEQAQDGPLTAETDKVQAPPSEPKPQETINYVERCNEIEDTVEWAQCCTELAKNSEKAQCRIDADKITVTAENEEALYDLCIANMRAERLRNREIYWTAFEHCCDLTKPDKDLWLKCCERLESQTKQFCYGLSDVYSNVKAQQKRHIKLTKLRDSCMALEPDYLKSYCCKQMAKEFPGAICTLTNVKTVEELKKEERIRISKINSIGFGAISVHNRYWRDHPKGYKLDGPKTPYSNCRALIGNDPAGLVACCRAINNKYSAVECCRGVRRFYPEVPCYIEGTERYGGKF